MAEAKNTNKILIILLIITIMIVMGLAGFFGYYIFLKKPASSNPTQPKKVAEKNIQLKEFVVNLADEEKTYIKLTIVLGYTNNKVETEVNDKMHIVRDLVNTRIRSKKTEDFSNSSIEKVKKEIMDDINSTLEKGKITNIYFNDIIIQ